MHATLALEMHSKEANPRVFRAVLCATLLLSNHHVAVYANTWATGRPSKGGAGSSGVVAAQLPGGRYVQNRDFKAIKKCDVSTGFCRPRLYALLLVPCSHSNESTFGGKLEPPFGLAAFLNTENTYVSKEIKFPIFSSVGESHRALSHCFRHHQR